MTGKTNAGGREKIGGPLLAVGWLIVVAPAISWYFWGPLASKPQIVVAWMLIYVALFVVLTYVTFLWWKGWLSSIQWGILNHILPVVFVLLPPVFGVLILDAGALNAEPVVEKAVGEYSAIVSKVFFPTYYSLMVVVSTMFIMLLIEVEDRIGKLNREKDAVREFNRWRVAGATCLLIGFIAALLYALPYIDDIKGNLFPDQQSALFVFAGLMALFVPLVAIWIKAHLMIDEKPPILGYDLRIHP